MGLFLRDKKDGRKTAGYGVYLLAGLFSIGGVLYLRSRVAQGVPPGSRRVAPSDVTAITQPAALVSKIDVKASRGNEKGPPSYRPGLAATEFPRTEKAAATEPAAHDSFDTIDAALRQAAAAAEDEASKGELHTETAPSGNGTAPAIAELPPAFAPTVAGTEPASRGSPWVNYRDSAVDAPPARRAADPEVPADSIESFVPKGSLIRVYLLTTVDTGNPAAILQLGTAQTLVFNHRDQLPFGTRFLGKLSGQPMRDRLNLEADTILYPDGLELPIRASAVEADEAGGHIHPGVGAYYQPPPGWAQVAPYLADFITGYAGLLQSRAEQPLTASVGGLSLQTTTADPRPPLYQASSQAIQAFTQSRLKEIEQRYATYYLIPAGTALWLQLDQDLDLRRAHAKNRKPTPDFAGIPASLPLSKEGAPK